MDITQGNKLIAEFMGVTISVDEERNQYAPGMSLLTIRANYTKPFVFIHDIMRHVSVSDSEKIENESIEKMWSNIAKLSEYHASWDWLMPVFEKITKITYDDGDSAYARTFGMISSDNKRPMVRINRQPLWECNTLIEATWLAVVEFIKSNKKSDNA